MITPDLLRRHPLAGFLNREQQNLVAALADEIGCPAGQVLFREGQPADGLYVLVEGSARLYHSDRADLHELPHAEALYLLMEYGADLPILEAEAEAHVERVVGEIHPGEIIGISALIDPHRYTASARTSAPSRLLKINAVELRQHCAADCALAAGLLKAVAKTTMVRLHYARLQLTDLWA